MPCSVVMVGNKMRERAIINRLKYIGAKMSYFFRGLFLIFRTRRIWIRSSYLLLTFIGCCNLNGYVFYDCDRRQGFLCLSIRTVGGTKVPTRLAGDHMSPLLVIRGADSTEVATCVRLPNVYKSPLRHGKPCHLSRSECIFCLRLRLCLQREMIYLKVK